MVVRRFSVQSGSGPVAVGLLPVQFDSVITGFQVAISKYLSSGVNKTFGTGGFETFFLFLNFSFFREFLGPGIKGPLGSRFLRTIFQKNAGPENAPFLYQKQNLF